MNPLSALFASGAAFRNTLYDRHFLKSHRLSRPVLSVGNISVGGSGKTPFVIALGTLLKQQGIAFDVLSRGYGRQSNDILVVDPNGWPDQFGDEPLLMARRLGVPVIVGADRYQAGLLAEKQFPEVKLHLLDDGFQHRRLHRDFDIVLLTSSDLQDTLLPMGRLREPIVSLQRADALVNAPEGLAGGTKHHQQQRWHTTRRLLNVPAQGVFPQPRALAFCGLGRPQQFFTSLKDSGANVIETATFYDHHRYRQVDIDLLLSLRNRSGAEVFITTEKDEINLGLLAAKLQPLQVVQLQMEIAEAEQVVSSLLNLLQ
jgi:tetraacyldisaccharide 4'-kinase